MDADAVLGALDERQRTAATSPAMPLAVVAPAGSGKTRVLAARIAHRVATGDADPEHLLCVTFTRKAADELRARLRAIGLHDRIEAGTFHAIAWRQLRDRWAAANRREPELLDRVRPFLREHVAVGARPREVAELAAECSWAAARMIRPDDYAEAATAAGRRTMRPKDGIADAYRRFEEAKSRLHLVDFGDLLLACASAIEGDPAFADAQRWRFRHLFVDEFQDVNPAQFRLLEAWRGDRWDVFVVGDGHQSIYGWNGADPSLLDDLGRHWPALEVIHLERTHRSTPQITAAAAAVVRAAGLPGRHPTSTGAPGPPARVHAHPDPGAEVAAVATAIRRARGPGRDWSSFAVLARTQDQVAEVERGLDSLGVPTQVRAPSRVLGSPAVRRVLARLSDDGRSVLVALDAALAPEWTAATDDAAADDAAGGDDPIVEFARLAEEHAEREPTTTGRALAGWARSRLSDDPGRSTADAVSVATIHAAKGLEWPVVHIVGCEEGTIPHVSARRKAARAEEARLLYVAITRAEEEVHLHWAGQRSFQHTSRARERSSFLSGFEDAVAAAETTGGADVPDPAVAAGPLAAARHLVGPTSDPDPILAALREWRAHRALAVRTAPEVVLDDRMLEAIARDRPTTRAGLAAIGGWGPARIERLADELLGVLGRYAGPAEIGSDRGGR